jgi:hypothetical protein
VERGLVLRGAGGGRGRGRRRTRLGAFGGPPLADFWLARSERTRPRPAVRIRSARSASHRTHVLPFRNAMLRNKKSFISLGLLNGDSRPIMSESHCMCVA